MGSHRRRKRYSYRETALSTATGGILTIGSVLGVTAGAQAADAAARTQLAGACQDHDRYDDGDPYYDDGAGWGDDDSDGWWGNGGPSGDGDDGGDHSEACGPGRHRGAPHPHEGQHRQHHGKHRTGRPTGSTEARRIAREMIPDSAQFGCFAHVIQRESGWKVRARDRSGAYGLPQALPGRRMASAGADWRTNPRTQIRWAIGYMHHRYGSECGAWTYWRHHHWY
jgi:hypothetical protein